MDPGADLLRRWREDEDPDALDKLLRIEVGVLKHVLRGRGAASGPTTASDIAQEAVAGLLGARRPPSFDDPRALRAYLWRSAWRLLCRRYEKASRRPPRVDLEVAEGASRFVSTVGGLDGLDAEERATAVAFAMRLLGGVDRDLVRKVYFEGADIAAAGAAVGLSREAANSRLVRARRLLAERLGDWAEFIS
jgi:RNA polymerase sigma factor (sigma-70 family)